MGESPPHGYLDKYIRRGGIQQLHQACIITTYNLYGVIEFIIDGFMENTPYGQGPFPETPAMDGSTRQPFRIKEIIMKLTAAFMLLITLLCTSVRATEELPVVYAVLPTDYTHIFRRPSFIIVNNRLILCWQRPSPGEKDELPVISAITGEKTQLKSRPPGLKPATIEYITLQLDDLTHQLPITTPQGRIELPEPAGLFPDYTLALSDNGKYLIGYSSDLRYTHLNSAKSVTLMELQYIEGQVVPSVSWTLPNENAFYGHERILKDI